MSTGQEVGLSTGGPRRTCSSRSCTHRSGVRPSSRGPGSSMSSTRRTCRSPSWPRHPATGRRRCWPSGRGVILPASPGCRSTGTTTTSDGWCRTRPRRSSGSSRSTPSSYGPSVGGRSVAAVASRVAGAISAMKEPVVLVLDHVESLHNDDCRDTIAEVALHLPAGSRLALATRADPPLPMARLRVGGDVVEVGVDELAMKAPEARRLLDGAGVQHQRRRAGPSARAHRGMARRLVPRSSCVAGGRLAGPRGTSLLRRRPADGGLPAVRAAVTPLAGRGRLPHAHGHPRSAERAAVRCGARQHRLGRSAGVARTLEPVARRPRPDRPVVSVPPPVPRPPARRAATS